jgi:hypothetical protein
MDDIAHQTHKKSAPLRLRWGAGKIGEYLGLTARQVHHLLSVGHIKCAKKIAGRWVADEAGLDAEFAFEAGRPSKSEAAA